MPAFIDQYVRELSRKRERFAASFDTGAHNDVEQTLAAGVRACWHALPAGAEPEPRPTFAVDGASALRTLNNGAAFLVCQSALIGPDIEESMVAAEIVRGGDARDASRALDRLRQFCEFAVAARHLDRMAGGVLLVDGSLLSDLSHMLYLRPMPLGDYPDLRSALVDSFLALVEGCRQRDILLVGVSKSTRDSLLFGSLLEDARGAERLCDAEILHRWTDDRPGFTRPILFGTDGTSAARLTDDAPETDDVLTRRIGALPCIAVFYVRLAGGEDALRVDVTGHSIGCSETLLAFRRAWGEADSVAPLVRRLVAQHGGPNVYNGPLYAADRVVRLSGKTMDGAYMALLREATGRMVSYDRGSRRFLAP